MKKKPEEDENPEKEVIDQAIEPEQEKKSPVEKKKKLSGIAKFLPSAVTITSMCFGLSAIRFALYSKWEYAVLCIFISALLDMMDGKVARLLDQSSSFGLELDSLSDLVCFGVAPAIVTYLVSMSYLGRGGWGACMFFAVCCAFRLARFNATHMFTEKVTDLDRKFFTGVPAPAGAIMALFPLMAFFVTGNNIFLAPYFVGFFLVISGVLMISTCRTFSSKMIEIDSSNAWIALAVIAALIIGLITKLWTCLLFLTLLYILLIPCGIYQYSRMSKEKAAEK